MSRDVHFKTAIAHAIGKNAAIFLNQCVFWQSTDYVNNRKDNPERNGWFYKSRDEWYDEILLSRYQQEQVRKKLREMGLLIEDRERTNIGIRIWYRVNMTLYYGLLNSLTKKSKSENNTDVLYDSSLTEQSENKVTDYSYNYENSSYSNYVFNNKTIVLNTGLNESYKPENGTNVLDNKDIEMIEYSDNHCIDNNDEIEIESIDVQEQQEADASSYSADLSNCPDNKKHYIDPDTFVFCHPFIYQFIRYCHNEASDDFLETLVHFGLGHFEVQETLVRFVERHGHAILEYYRKNAPVAIEPLTRADIDDAIRASLGA